MLRREFYSIFYELKGNTKKIRRAKQNKCNITLVVIRVSPLYGVCMSKPCKNCLRRLKKNNIGKVIYSVKGGDYVEEKVRECETEHLSKRYRSNGIGHC